MSWLHSQMALLTAATTVVELALNWVLQSTLLIALGLLGGRLLQQRGSAVQSAVYRTTLAAVLLCPIASMALWLAGVSGWSVALPEPWTLAVATVEATPNALPAPEPLERLPAQPIDPETPPQQIDTTTEADRLDAPTLPLQQLLPQEIAGPPAQEATHAATSVEPEPGSGTQPVAAPAALSVHNSGWTALAICALWLLLCAVWIGRLATAWWQLSRLCRRAVPAEDMTQQACRELSNLLGVRAPQVLRTPYLPSPCLAGLRQAVILLPDEDIGLSMRDVLVHELAHLVRRDCHWNLLRQLALSLFFFQPLLWMLSRRLESAAEEVCDDYVVQFGGDRQQYAHRLVDIAELSTAPVAPAGVGIVSLRSMLAKRVQRIMDTSRSLSTRVGSVLLFVVLVAGLLGTLIAGLVGVGPSDSVAQVPSTATQDEAPGISSQESDRDTDTKPTTAAEESSLAGVVLGADGKPVAGARFYWFRSRVLELEPMSPQLVAESDGAGEFNFELPPVGAEADGPLGWEYHDRIVVRASGHGFVVTSPHGLRQETERSNSLSGTLPPATSGSRGVTVKLPLAGNTLRGQIVDIDGQPVKDAMVRIRWYVDKDNHFIQSFLSEEEARDKDSALWRVRVAALVNVIEPPPLRHVLPMAKTDGQGRFEIHDVGTDRMFQLLVEGEHVESADILARNEPGEVIEVLPERHTGDGDVRKVYPRDILHVAGPSNPVTGIVTDFDSGQPIADAMVRAYLIHGNELWSIREREEFAAHTDAQGRYRITGLPMGNENGLVAFTMGDQPYIAAGVQVDTSNSGAEAVHDFRLRRGVWAEGRVFDSQSGRPFTGEISYYYFDSDQLRADFPGLDEAFIDGQFWTNPNGEFRVPVLPARGILAYRYDGSSHDRDGIEQYPRGYGAESIAGYQHEGSLPYFRTQPSRLIPSNYQRVVEVHPTAGQMTIRADMPLVGSTPVTIRVVDADGKPVTGYRAYNAETNWGWKQQDSAQFVVTGLKPDERRKIFIYHRQRNLSGAVMADSSNREPVEIKLQPAGSITGQLVDADGAPAGDATLLPNLEALRDDDRVAIWPPHPELKANPTNIPVEEQGRFRLDGLVGGMKYSAHVSAPVRQNGRVNDQIVAQALINVVARSGETIDLGQIDITSDKRPGLTGVLMTPETNNSSKVVEPPKSDAAAQADKPAAARDGKITVQGRVLGDDGSPVAGASVYAAWMLTRHVQHPSSHFDYTIVAEDKSDDQGNYELTFSTSHPDPPRLSLGWHVAAFAPGLAPAWQTDDQVQKNVDDKQPTNLTLTGAQIVRGRVVDLEGNPVSGVHVRVHNLRRPESDRALLDWLKEAKEKSPPANVDDYYNNSFSASPTTKSPYAAAYPALWRDRFLQHGSLALPANTSTDEEGQFQLQGLGSNQLAVLELESPAIAKCYAHVVVRDMAPVAAKPFESMGVRTGTYFGEEFQFVAEPTQPISGTVTDAKSGQPLADLEVRVNQFAGSRFSQEDFLTTRTDGEGRYSLIGAPTGGGHRIEVNPSPNEPYFPTEKNLDKISGIEPLALDFVLHRGQWIVGKVTDQHTGEPIKNANVEYLPLRDNEFAKDYPNYRPEITGSVPSQRYHTSDDGSFRVLAIPGPGILAAIARDEDKKIYASLSRDMVPEHLVQKNGQLNTYDPWVVTGYHALREVDLAKSADDTTIDLQLTKGLTRAVRLVDAQGQPVKGVHVLSRNAPPSLEGPLDDSTVTIIGLQPNETRAVVFIQADRRIGKAVMITGGETMTVELEPCAVAHGRVVDEDGKPVAELPINVTVDKSDTWHRPLVGTATDEDGRFEAILAPGTTCRVWHYSKNGSDFSAVCRAEAGATFELGDLTNETKLDASQTAKLRDKTAGELKGLDLTSRAATSSQPSQATVVGRITLPDGQAAGGAHVALVAMRTELQRGGDLSHRGEVLAEGIADASGAYQLTLSGVSSKSHRYANLLARKDGYGIGWKQVDLDAMSNEIPLALAIEEPIRGRLVNIEGLPAGNVRLAVRSLMKTTTDGERIRDGVGYSGEVIPQAWFQPLVSDEQGRFTLVGIPAGYGTFLIVEGDDHFAPQDVALNTGMSEQRGQRDGTYRALVFNTKPGEEAVLPLSPAQLFEGTVTYQDTGEPAAGARLTIWASQQEPFGSMVSVAGRADENGRYRISPRPGIRFGVNAYPPDGAPYLARETGPSDGIRWNAGDRVRQVDVQLRRGVLVRGTVVEAGTDQPVAGASIQYHPESAHNPNVSEDVLTGWQGIQLSDDEGKFEIVVLPGPGRLLVHGPQDKHVLREISERELSRGAKGGRRYYANAIERVDPAVGADSIERTIHLEPSVTTTGKLVDEQGQPVDKVSVISRLFVMPHSPFWRGYGGEVPQPRAGNTFDISGLAASQECPVYFLDKERRLGATEILTAGMPEKTVVLKPCGQATARYIDTEGNPLAGFDPTLFVVVTPGAHTYDYDAAKRGELSADEDFLSNVDSVNYRPWPKTDEQGRITFAALIPGATYRLYGQQNDKPHLLKEFTVNAGQKRDLGDFTIDAKD